MSSWHMLFNHYPEDADVNDYVITKEDVEKYETLDEHDIGRHAINANGTIICIRSIKEIEDATV